MSLVNYTYQNKVKYDHVGVNMKIIQVNIVQRPFWKSDLGHFGWPKITFDRFRSIRNFCFHKMAISNYYYIFYNMVVGGHFGWPKITFNRISRHFISICFFSQNGCRRPFWITENHFRSHFSPFQIHTQLWFFFTKWLLAAILDNRKSLFDCISRHFRSIHNFYWFFFTKWLPAAILVDRKSLSMAFLAISDQCTTFYFFSQNGCRRTFWMTENHFHPISRHFRSIHNFFCSKWLPAAILVDRKSLWMAFSPFHINAQLLIFFHKMAAGGHFWMTENHFRSHFSPFQLKTQLFFFHKMAAGGHFGWQKITFNRITRHFRSKHNFSFFWFIF